MNWQEGVVLGVALLAAVYLVRSLFAEDPEAGGCKACPKAEKSPKGS